MADKALFFALASTLRASVEEVPATMLAYEDPEALDRTLGVIGAEGEGGNAPSPPRRDKKGGLSHRYLSTD